MFDLENARYRTTFVDAENEMLTQKSRKLDYMFLLEYITRLYLKYPSLFEDEYVQNRVGLKKILNLLVKTGRDGRVLDVGCGNCELLMALAKLGFSVTGLDASPSRVVVNRQRLRKVFFGFSECMPFDDGEFRTVIATECLEHVLSADLTLREMRRVMEPGGTAYIQVPNRNLVDSATHVRLFSAQSLAQLVGEYFAVESVECMPYLTGEHENNLFCIARKA